MNETRLHLRVGMGVHYTLRDGYRAGECRPARLVRLNADDGTVTLAVDLDPGDLIAMPDEDDEEGIAVTVNRRLLASPAEPDVDGEWHHPESCTS